MGSWTWQRPRNSGSRGARNSVDRAAKAAEPAALQSYHYVKMPVSNREVRRRLNRGRPIHQMAEIAGPDSFVQLLPAVPMRRRHEEQDKPRESSNAARSCGTSPYARKSFDHMNRTIAPHRSGLWSTEWFLGRKRAPRSSTCARTGKSARIALKFYFEHRARHGQCRCEPSATGRPERGQPMTTKISGYGSRRGAKLRLIPLPFDHNVFELRHRIPQFGKSNI